MFGWEFPPHNSGGLGVACQGIVRALAKEGTQVTFVLPRKMQAASDFARILFAGEGEEENVTWRTIHSSLVPYVTAESYAERVFSLQPRSSPPVYGTSLIEEVFRYAFHAKSIAQKEEYDVIYAHDWLSFPAGIEAKIFSKKQLIVHVHSTEFDRCGGAKGVNPEVYAIEKMGMEFADKVIVVSQFTKNIIVLNYGIPSEKVEVVHNGIDEETVPKPGNGFSKLSALKDAGYSVVLFLGRITLQKGLDHLLRAAQKVVRDNPKVVFLVSGSGDMERQMMQYAAELGIAHNVLFTGFLRGADQYDAYRLADLFVMPSVSEPFGITALEAMKLGTPVLVSKQSGVSEAVQHVLKVDFWDTEDLAHKILSTIAYAPLRSTLTLNGLREAERLTWQNAVGKINRVIENCA